MSGMTIYATFPGLKKEPITVPLTATVEDFCREVLHRTGFRIFEGFGFSGQSGTVHSVAKASAITKNIGYNLTSNKVLAFDFYGATGTPAQPTGTPDTGSGTLGAASYYARVTYVNAAGESLPSVESAAIVLSAPGNITIDSPAANSLATGWNVYISSTPGSGWKKQNSSLNTIGVNFTRSTALDTNGATVPTTDTTPIPATSSVTISSLGISAGDELLFMNVEVGG